jgi:FkbM family methyltransferase
MGMRARRPPLKYRIARLIGHQHYIPHGRDRFIRLFATPDRATSTAFTVDFFGQVYRGDLSNFLDWSVYVYGAYAKHELILLRDITEALRAELTSIAFYDVGANVGQHTLFMSKVADEVFSFEPYEPARKKLLQKLEDNEVRNVRVFPVGLGAQNENLEFHAPKATNMGMGTFCRIPDFGTVLKLPMRQGDALFAENRLPRITLMKVDVEGFESAVFEGLRKRIWQDRPVIMTEISGPDRSGFRTPDGFARTLYDGFELFSVGCTSISGTYSIQSPSFDTDEELLVIPIERTARLKHILNKS